MVTSSRYYCKQDTKVLAVIVGGPWFTPLWFQKEKHVSWCMLLLYLVTRQLTGPIPVFRPLDLHSYAVQGHQTGCQPFLDFLL